MKFYGVIEKGELKVLNRGRFLQEIKQMKDGTYEIDIKLKNRRSVPQNGYYWSTVIFEIRHRLEQLGNRFTPEQVHDLLKAKFLAIPISNEHGEVVEVPGSTAGLNKAEFAEYLDNVIQWAAEFLSIEIPAPETDLKLSL